MKRISFWLFLVSLLYITFSDVNNHNHQIKQGQRTTSIPYSAVFVYAPRGTSKNIVLPDGTLVSLNSASTLAYHNDIATGDRTVELFGEAFFNVVAKPSRPFRVRAKEMLIEVLGTRFNVRDYPDEAYTKAFVKAGAIRVKYHDSSTILYPGDEADINPTRLDGGSLVFKQGIDTTTMADWTKGFLSFDDIDLPSLLRELSRAYDVDIELRGRTLAHRFKALLPRKEPLDQVIERIIVPYANVLISRPEKHRLIITVKS